MDVEELLNIKSEKTDIGGKEQNIIERSLNLEPWRPFIFLPAFALGRTFERALFIGGATLR